MLDAMHDSVPPPAADWRALVRAELPVERTDTRVRDDAVQTFEDTRAQVAAKRKSETLTDPEIDDLQDLWSGYAAELGSKSLQGGLEATLLLSPPREQDARDFVLQELHKQYGRCSEGKIIRIVAFDWGLTYYEVRCGIERLVAQARKVERVPVPPPTSAPGAGLTQQEHDWTGWDLKLLGRERGDLTMRLALARAPRTRQQIREARWRAEDEALEREWRQMHQTGQDGGAKDYEPDPAPIGSRAAATLDALERMRTVDVSVLRAAYEDYMQGDHLDDTLGKLLPRTRAVVDERRARAEKLAGKRKSNTLTGWQLLNRALREVRAEDVLRSKRNDDAFMATAKRQAEKLLVDACAAYRKASRKTKRRRGR